MSSINGGIWDRPKPQEEILSSPFQAFEVPVTLPEVKKPVGISGVTSSDEFSDVIFMVEEKPLYANRAVLGIASPVFKTMFVSDFKEKDSTKVDLPGKTYADFMDFLVALTPGNMNPVTEKNAHILLPLADEYLVTAMKQMCEEKMLPLLAANQTEINFSMAYMILAQTYSLERIKEQCVKILCKVTSQGLQQHPRFSEVHAVNQAMIYKERVVLLEQHVSPHSNGFSFPRNSAFSFSS